MSNNIAWDLPINSLSFGNVSIAILRELRARGLHPAVFPLSNQIDLSTQKEDKDFNTWLNSCVHNAQVNHSRENPVVKLWHIQNSLQSYSSKDSRLITFHETDALTNVESNILKNQDKVYVTSNFTKSVFESLGINSEYLPLGFDSHNFKVLEKRPKVEGVVQFGIGGKLEVRKGHLKVLNLWAKKYGNNIKYRLNAAIHNPFLKPEHTQALINQALEGKTYNNINFLPYMATNAEYNQFLNTNDIYIAMSGGEGRDLPAYHSAALGAWVVGLKAHAYLDYLNDGNAVLVEPNSKRPAADGIFFHQNSPFNVGNFFDFSDSDFISACEEAEKKAAIGRNISGIELQKLTYQQTVDVLVK